jgi:hypothetical protein
MRTPLAVGLHTDVCEVAPSKTYRIVTGERYLQSLEDGTIRCWPDTHVFIINDETGDILIDGDRGTYAYCWPASVRGGRTLRTFLAELSFGYFMTKAAKQPHMVDDIDATITKMKREVLRDRRDGDLDLKKAREIWNLIEDVLDPGQDRREFERALYDDAVLYERYCDGGVSIIQVEHPGTRAFWDEAWATFRRDVLLADAGEVQSITAAA